MMNLAEDRMHPFVLQHPLPELSKAKSRVGSSKAETIRQRNINIGMLRVLGHIVALELL